MIPAPPHDPALPGIRAALDGDAMRTLLAAHAAGDSELVSCRPKYVRYKPGTSFLVEYRIGFAGQPAETIAHVTLFAGPRAQKLWSKGSLQRLAAEERGPLAAVAHLPELAAVLQTYPVDLALPSLVVAASPEGRRRVLREIGGPDSEATAELVRYKPGRKALLRYGSRYAKLYEDDRGPVVLAAGRALEAARIGTARPVAYLESLRLIVHDEAPGTPLRALHGDDFTDGAHAAGAALSALHAAHVGGLRRHSWADEAADLAAAARAVTTLRPDLGEDATRVAADVIDRLAELNEVSVSAHGDFSDDQVLVTQTGAVLLDLDEIRSTHPLLDVGNFLAHLSLREDGEARAAFLDGYGFEGNDQLDVFEAGALLKLTVDPFRRLEDDWPEGLQRRLALARSRLPRSRRRGPLDPALPQLTALTQPALVESALAAALGDRVRVRQATVVRHKPGRRAVLRYEVDVDGRTERVYGKTYASDRGARVFRNLQALALEPIAFLPGLRLLLQHELRGDPVRDAMLAGDEAVAARIAEVVHELHESPAQLAREHTLVDELAVLHGRVEALAEHRGRAHHLLERLERALERSWIWRSAPVHRDLYHDQVLLDGDSPVLLDLDDAAMSEPALDVANFLAHLRLLALQEPLSRERVAQAASAFRKRSGELDPSLDPELVRLLEAGTLLRLACIHLELTRRLLRETAALLPA